MGMGGGWWVTIASAVFGVGHVIHSTAAAWSLALVAPRIK